MTFQTQLFKPIRSTGVVYSQKNMPWVTNKLPKGKPNMGFKIDAD